MEQLKHISMLLPLAVGAVTILGTIVIHALPLSATITIVRHERRLGRAGRGFWLDMGIVAGAILSAWVAHLLEIAVWGAVFMACGELASFSIIPL
jgi:hypothetical protein